MLKKKKILSLVAATCIVTTSISPAFAKVTDYVTEDGSGETFKYNKDALLESILNGTSLYNNYKSQTLKALLDDQRGYIDANDVRNAITSTDNLDVDSYTESTESKQTDIKVDNTVSVDENGEVVVTPEKEELKVESVSAINATTISVTFSGKDAPEEAVEIELEEALNHGQNLVTFTYKGQTFEVMVTYIDDNVVEVEEAISVAEKAIESLSDFGDVTFENKAQAIQAILDVQSLINKAQELDGNVTFNKYPMEQLQEKINQVNAQADEATAKAQAAIDALDEIAVEDVTKENKSAVIAQVAEARELIRRAQELDTNVTFNTYQLDQLEAKIASLNEDVDAAVNEAQAAIDALDEYDVENVTDTNKEEIRIAINSAKALIETAQELDENVTFNTYQLDQLQAKIDNLDNINKKLNSINEADTQYAFNKALTEANITGVNKALLNKYMTNVEFVSLEEVQAKVDLVNTLDNALDGQPITLEENIKGDIEINNIVSVNFNGKTIDGNVSITTDSVGTITLGEGTIKGDVIVDAPNATINNSATIEGEVIIGGEAQGFFRSLFAAAPKVTTTWNEKANGNKIVSNLEGVVLNVSAGKTVKSLKLDKSTTVNVANGASFEEAVIVNADSTIVSKEPVKAVIAQDAQVTIKTDKEDTGIVVEGTENNEEVDLTLQLATKAVEEYEEKLDTRDKIVGLVNNDAKRNEVSALKTPAFNKVQLVKGEEKQALLNRLDVAHDKLIAATAVNGLQNATKDLTAENLDNAKIKLSNAKTNVKKLADGEIKTALQELVDEEEAKINKLVEENAAAQATTEAITAIPTNNNPLLNGEKIKAAKAAYDALNDTAKGLVSEENTTKLNKAVSEFITLAKGPANGAVTAVTNETDVVKKQAVVDEAQAVLNTAKKLGMTEAEYNHLNNFISEAQKLVDTAKVAKIKEEVKAVLPKWDTNANTTLTKVEEAISEIEEAKAEVKDDSVVITITVGDKSDTITIKGMTALEPTVQEKALNIKSQEELLNALANKNITELKLTADFEVTSAVFVNRGVTIDGNNKTITVNITNEADTTKHHGINVMAKDVTLKNLTVSGAKGSGIQLFNTATLENVESKENTKAGIYVNNDGVTSEETITVNFNGVKTSANGWKAGIGLAAQKDGSKVTANFTGTNTFGEDVSVYDEGTTYPGTYEVTGLKGYTSIKKDKQNIWVKSAEVSVKLPEGGFVVGQEGEFTVTTTANGLKDTQVLGLSTHYFQQDIKEILYYDTSDSAWKALPEGAFGNPGTGFPLADATSKFKITFKESAVNKEFTFTTKIVDAATQKEVLAETSTTFNVKAAVVEE